MNDPFDSCDNNSPSAAYEVGYGKPPKHTQFKPGQRGNPKGRKKKPKSVQAQMQAAMSRKVTIQEEGKSKRLSMQELMLRSLSTKAAKGDIRAAGFVLELLNAPEFADGETIDAGALSTADQALLDQMLDQLGASSEVINDNVDGTLDRGRANEP